MGYSCAAAAAFALDSCAEILGHKADATTPKDSPNRAGADSYHPGELPSNAMPGGGFWERSNKEHKDGAVTGTTWRVVTTEGHVRRAGSFRIEPDGTVTKFPGMTPEERAEASAKAKARYHSTYGSPVRKDGQSSLGW